MIRANLLPRPKETFALFGFEIDAGYLRQAAVGIAIVAAIVLIGIAIERLRLQRLDGAASAQEAVLASRAAERAESKRLALDVARYQEIAREEDGVRRSGALAAISIARIGNAVPAQVWLESLAHDTQGFEVTGASHSVDGLSRAMLGLGSALPGRNASLINIDNRSESGDGIHFTARIGEPATTEQVQ